MSHTQHRDPTKIDLETARILLHQAMKTQGPDFVYNPKKYNLPSNGSCYNIPFGETPSQYESIPDDDPRRATGCLVGTAMRLGGVPYSVLLEKYNRTVIEFHYYVTDEAIEYFNAAQSSQDGGRSWSDSVSAAEAWLKFKAYAELKKKEKEAQGDS